MTTDSSPTSAPNSRPGDGPERGDANVLGLASLLWRRKWLLIACTTLATGLGVIVGKSLEARYTASALVMLEPRGTRVLEMKAVVEELDANTAAIETQLEVLRSRTLAANVIDSLSLVDDPELGGGPPQPEAPWLGYARAAMSEVLEQVRFSGIGAAQGRADPVVAALVSAEPSPSLALEAMPVPEKTLEAFRTRLRVVQQGDSYVMKVSFTSVDPAKAARVANAVAEQFIAYQLESKQSVTRSASEWLGHRLSDLRQELETSERAKQAFSAANGLMVANGIDVPDQELAQVAQSAVAARADASEKAAKVRMVERLRASGGRVDAIPEVMSSPLILALRTQEADLSRQEAELSTTFGSRHPRMQLIGHEKAMIGEKTRAEIDRILENLRVEADAAAARQASIERDVERIKATITQKRQAEVQLGEFSRESDASRQIYQQMLQRYKETREQQEITEPDARVLALAVPPQAPSTPGAVFFGAIGFTSSLLLTSLLVLLREVTDTTLRGNDEIERHLRVPRIGLVPAVRNCARNSRPHDWLLAKPRSIYASALQSVLGALRLRHSGPQLLLVTSSLPEEGKTTFAVSLAVCAAQTGRKVLLVDGDFRHPSVQRELSVRPQQGVVEYVLGEVELNRAVLHDVQAGIDVLGMGRLAANPIAVVEDAVFASRLQELKAHYDLVVIDSAPVLGIPETQLLAALADQAVFVVRWGSTKRNTAKHAMLELTRVGVPVAGAVLTRVNVKEHARHGYGDAGMSYSKYSRYYAS